MTQSEWADIYSGMRPPSLWTDMANGLGQKKTEEHKKRLEERYQVDKNNQQRNESLSFIMHDEKKIGVRIPTVTNQTTCKKNDKIQGYHITKNCAGDMNQSLHTPLPLTINVPRQLHSSPIIEHPKFIRKDQNRLITPRNYRVPESVPFTNPVTEIKEKKKTVIDQAVQPVFNRVSDYKIIHTPVGHSNHIEDKILPRVINGRCLPKTETPLTYPNLSLSMPKHNEYIIKDKSSEITPVRFPKTKYEFKDNDRFLNVHNKNKLSISRPIELSIDSVSIPYASSFKNQSTFLKHVRSHCDNDNIRSSNVSKRIGSRSVPPVIQSDKVLHKRVVSPVPMKDKVSARSYTQYQLDNSKTLTQTKSMLPATRPIVVYPDSSSDIVSMVASRQEPYEYQVSRPDYNEQPVHYCNINNSRDHIRYRQR